MRLDGSSRLTTSLNFFITLALINDIDNELRKFNTDTQSGRNFEKGHQVLPKAGKKSVLWHETLLFL